MHFSPIAFAANPSLEIRRKWRVGNDGKLPPRLDRSLMGCGRRDNPPRVVQNTAAPKAKFEYDQRFLADSTLDSRRRGSRPQLRTLLCLSSGIRLYDAFIPHLPENPPTLHLWACRSVTGGSDTFPNVIPQECRGRNRCWLASPHNWTGFISPPLASGRRGGRRRWLMAGFSPLKRFRSDTAEEFRSAPSETGVL